MCYSTNVLWGRSTVRQVGKVWFIWKQPNKLDGKLDASISQSACGVCWISWSFEIAATFDQVTLCFEHVYQNLVSSSNFVGQSSVFAVKALDIRSSGKSSHAVG